MIAMAGFWSRMRAMITGRGEAAPIRGKLEDKS
jgi:hypothetical protein